MVVFFVKKQTKQTKLLKYGVKNVHTFPALTVPHNQEELSLSPKRLNLRCVISGLRDICKRKRHPD
jgi:hypothetical protein